MKKNGLFSRLLILLCFLFLYAPILVLVVFSFNASKSKAVWAGFTLDWYVELFHNGMILNALWVTLAVSALAAVIATVMGTAAAIGFRNLRRRTRSVCMTVNNIPLTNADIITGVSMMLLFLLAVSAWNGSLGRMLGIKWNMGFWSLLIAHITFDVPNVILSVTPKLRQLDPNIYEAAQDLGDHGFHAFRKVVLPEIMPGWSTASSSPSRSPSTISSSATLPPGLRRRPCPWSFTPWPKSGSARRSTPCPPSCSPPWWP